MSAFKDKNKIISKVLQNSKLVLETSLQGVIKKYWEEMSFQVMPLTSITLYSLIPFLDLQVTPLISKDLWIVVGLLKRM